MNAPLNLYFNKGCIHVVGEWVIGKSGIWRIADFKNNTQLGSDDIELSRARNNYMFTKSIDEALIKESDSRISPTLLYHDESVLVTDYFFVIGRDACWGDDVKEVWYSDKPINSLRVVLYSGKTIEHRSMISKTLPDARDALTEMMNTPKLVRQKADDEVTTVTPTRAQVEPQKSEIQTGRIDSKPVQTPAVEKNIPPVVERIIDNKPKYIPTETELKLDLMGREIDHIDVIPLQIAEENGVPDASESEDISETEFAKLLQHSRDDENLLRSDAEHDNDGLGVRPSRRPLYGEVEAPEELDYFETKRLASDEEPDISVKEAEAAGEEVYYSGMAGLVTNRRIKSPSGYWLIPHIKTVDYAVLPWIQQPGSQAKLITGAIIFVFLMIIAAWFAFFVAIIFFSVVGKNLPYKPKGVVTITLYTGTKSFIIDRPEYGGELPQLAGAVRRALFEKK